MMLYTRTGMSSPSISLLLLQKIVICTSHRSLKRHIRRRKLPEGGGRRTYFFLAKCWNPWRLRTTIFKSVAPSAAPAAAGATGAAARTESNSNNNNNSGPFRDLVLFAVVCDSFRSSPYLFFCYDTTLRPCLRDPSKRAAGVFLGCRLSRVGDFFSSTDSLLFYRFLKGFFAACCQKKASI